jgi:oxygen-independent coproporphyrinogen-3 oxidase
MVEAIGAELVLRKAYLQGETVDSIYLGGGTPSLLSESELDYLFGLIYQHYVVNPQAEITLEANPDDIDQTNLAVWQSSPINRLSIGVQSFADDDLKFMNRAHNAVEASRCISWAQEAGFTNLTVDLIYGAPTTTDVVWKSNVQELIKIGVPHISCYALTVEPRTALAHQIKTGKTVPLDEEQAARQFEQLIAWLTAAGYVHYEISNFAKLGHFAAHNSSYWQAKHYLGVGPSAHSFNGNSRQWNIANNARYMAAVNQWVAEGALDASSEQPLFELEFLSLADQYNELVMTGLRTIWGVDVERLEQPYRGYFLKNIHQFVDRGYVLKSNKKYFLTPAGRLLADGIASDLFYS